MDSSKLSTLVTLTPIFVALSKRFPEIKKNENQYVKTIFKGPFSLRRYFRIYVHMNSFPYILVSNYSLKYTKRPCIKNNTVFYTSFVLSKQHFYNIILRYSCHSYMDLHKLAFIQPTVYFFLILTLSFLFRLL